VLADYAPSTAATIMIVAIATIMMVAAVLGA